MKRLGILGAILALVVTTLSPAWAGRNLNSSKSNIYRLTYPADLLSKEQASALLGDLDKVGRAWTTDDPDRHLRDEAALKEWLAANFRRFGIAADRVKKIVILFPGRDRDQAVQRSVAILRGARLQMYNPADPNVWILLLTNPADEAAAIAVSCCKYSY